MSRFDEIQSVLQEERSQCLQDRRFYSISGAQWEGTLADQFENKPKLEANKVHLAVLRIINEYRNNPITVDFVSKDGTQDDGLADTCDGLYRADEQDSGAAEAYDNAFEEAVSGGFGAWRLRAGYEDDFSPEDDKQRVRIEPITDADSCVFFDLNAKRQDKADAEYCFVLSPMTKKAFREQYGEEPVTVSRSISGTQFDWCTPDQVWVAEYYVVEERNEMVRKFIGVIGDERVVTEAEIEQVPDLPQILEATGYRLVSEKRVKTRAVHKYLMDGSHVLEDEGIIVGKHLPVVPAYGKRWYIDGVERCAGHVRYAKDAQRLANMQLSKLAEIASLSAIEKPIFHPEQVAGHEYRWSEDNVKNYPYQLVNQLTDANGNTVPAGPVAYTHPPQLPPAMAALLQLTDSDMQTLLGNQQAAEQLQPNLSGKAIELVQNKLDMQVAIYASNMAKAMRRSGEIWLSMAKELYTQDGRSMKAIGSQGESSAVEINRPVLDESGAVTYENDLSKAAFDVAVSVGPSSSSKKAATVRALTGMLTLVQDPETAQVLTSMALMNMEGEGVDQVRDYFRKKLLRMGVVEPTEDEAKQLAAEAANQPPDPQAQYLQSAAMQAQAEAEKAKANSILAVAKAEESRAKTAATIAGIDRDDADQVLKTVETIQRGSAQRFEQRQTASAQPQQGERRQS